jgi:hypothetical protein
MRLTTSQDGDRACKGFVIMMTHECRFPLAIPFAHVSDMHVRHSASYLVNERPHVQARW